MASGVLTKPSTGVKGVTGNKRWRVAGQHRAGIHCCIAIDGVRDAHQEADYAADTSTDDIALRRRRAHSVDPDQPFRPIVITNSGDPDHGVHLA